MQLGLNHIVDALDQIGKTGITFEESGTIKFISQINVHDLRMIKESLIDVKWRSYIGSQVAQISLDLNMNLRIY